MEFLNKKKVFSIYSTTANYWHYILRKGEKKMFVIKRNGEKVPFDKQKIVSAINGALIEVDTFLKDDELAITIAETIHRELYGNNLEEIEVEDIQDWVEDLLMESDRIDVARAYVRYRYK